MTDARDARTDFFSTRAGRIVRDVLAALIALAFLGLVIFLAAMLTAAFLVIAGIGVLTFGAFWLWRKIRGRKGDDVEILVATRGPDGWTVDGLGR